MPAFLKALRESGRSSQLLLQNIIPHTGNEALAYALWCAEKLLEGEGACRVHGGGFAGTVLALVPLEREGSFRREIERILGEGCCHRLKIRPVGGVLLEKRG